MKLFNYEKVFSFYFGIFAFASLVFPKQIGLFVVFLALVIISGFVMKQLTWKLNFISILFITLYLSYIVGIFFAHELSNGLKYAEYKLAFLLIPLLMSVQTKFNFNLRSAFIGLILATIFLGIYGILNAYNCFSTHNSNWLFYCFSSSYISPIHHPSYYSCFLLFAIVGAWYGYLEKWIYFKIIPVILFSLFALLMYGLCLSLAAFLFLGIVIVTFIAYLIYKKYGKWITSSFLVVSIIFFPILLFNTPSIGEDIRTTTKSLTEYFSSPQLFLSSTVDSTEIPGNQKRLIMWTVTGELIVEHPFGVGTGNVDDYIDPRLEKYGFHELVEEDLNPHNQYLQTTLEIGLIGGLILIVLFGSICWIGIKRKSYLLFFLGASLAFNSLFESMLQQQSGIVFYTFWILLISIILNEKKQIAKDSLTLQ